MIRTKNERLPLARKARELREDAFNAIRPVWFFALATAGIGFALDYLQTHPWHHAMVMWAVPAGAGAYALVGLYRSVRARLEMREWFREDAREGLRRLDEVKPHVPLLAPWTRARYLERRAQLHQDKGRA